MKSNTTKIAIIGQGYVGLPLAVEFGKKFKTIGFDIDKKRINELSKGVDNTLELSTEEMNEAPNLVFSHQIKDIIESNIYIVTVPTPIDIANKPNLKPLQDVSMMLGKIIKENDIVIYESTVYPGVTEEVCIPLIEKESGLKFNKNFYAGYSPERINPGDKKNRLTNIKKITSGSNDKVAKIVDTLYNEIIKAGTYKAKSIKVAEAAKVTENIQRDVNIALINELHQIFTKLDIKTSEVIEAASTKWNFMKLNPGLVGGHCISVDPYYLLHKAEKSGFIPDLIRSAREINNGMPEFYVNDLIKKLLIKKINPINLKIAILGFSFKENCPDIRNTKVYDLYTELLENGFDVNIYDDIVNKDEVYEQYHLKINSLDELHEEVLIITTPHKYIKETIKVSNYKFVYNIRG